MNILLTGGAGYIGSHVVNLLIDKGYNVTVIDNLITGTLKLINKKATFHKIDLNKLVAEADLLIGGVLIPGAEAPKLVTKDMLKLMKRGSVIVDVAIDQGGCVETSKPTTHGDPTYVVDDVVHYCVANMPGGVPRTSTIALNNATLPFLVKLANKGYQKALGEDKNFLAGLNVCQGNITYKAVADVFGYEYVAPDIAVKN